MASHEPMHIPGSWRQSMLGEFELFDHHALPLQDEKETSKSRSAALKFEGNSFYVPPVVEERSITKEYYPIELRLIRGLRFCREVYSERSVSVASEGLTPKQIRGDTARGRR